MVNKQSSQQLLHQARSAIVDQVRHDIRQSNTTTTTTTTNTTTLRAANSTTPTPTHPQQRLQHGVLKENNQTTTTGGRFPKSHRLAFGSGDAENDKQYLEEKEGKRRWRRGVHTRRWTRRRTGLWREDEVERAASGPRRRHPRIVTRTLLRIATYRNGWIA